ncbi:carbamoyltransferase family protein [Amycolatopsis cihanbeyliensis]|uniref:Carbamoyltransferase n=1 Tax=Amycolatopsis cihanbeyliensis TaxID=1128664 RepID=A0A542DBJ4_AMYCI|nr:carbamoyltransferase C-terminal domain-containing protein [Amycolatopsis cihanbeyliensis]TQJ00434.1 carbamoyltransferase [Amycolatopsis cihanbeyliensis]
MLTLGLAGGLDPAHDVVLDTPENYTYDGAAVLVRDGVIIAAAEEERLNRIKHSNKFPVSAIRFCLDEAGVRPEEIDRFAYYVDEAAANALLTRLYLRMPDWPLRADARTMFAGALGVHLGCEVEQDKLDFYAHKLTHAAGALAHSGFDDTLVYVVDSAGGVFDAGWTADGALRLEELVAIPPARSMNQLWEKTLPFLGFGLFEEYKAMALAAHGDPARFRPLLEQVCRRLPDGDYAVDLATLDRLAGEVPPRPRHEEPAEVHRDLAAALQEATEEVVLHVLRHYRERTGRSTLCMAGGMIENTAVSGRVLRSGLFDDVFVHPAAYDSGCAVGAGLLAANDAGDRLDRSRVRHVYWGRSLGGDQDIDAELAGWSAFVDVARPERPAEHVAGLLAEGKVLGWVRGRAEFGSHALGNRSILADARRKEARARVNEVTGRNEPYRPLAPSVPVERAADFFVLPGRTGASPFMTFALEVRPEWRAELPAVTHADGTAKLHTVAREDNPGYWELLTAFGARTGVPVLLNTSFNNSTEPTVDSVRDAVVAFLTTGLDGLVVGDRVLSRADPAEADWRALEVSVPPYVKLFRVKGQTERDQGGARHEIRTTYDPPVRRRIGPAAAALLDSLDRPANLGDALDRVDADPTELLAELRGLWAERFLRLAPQGGAA